MSYILDALKKSEQKRSVGNIPSLDAAVHERRKHSVTNLGLVATITVSVAVTLAVVWALWQRDSAPESSDDRVATQNASPPSTAARTASPLSDVAAAQNTPVLLSDLDQEFRSGLPPLSLSVITYSEDRTRRFAMIDQSIYREGESIDAGIRVETISRDKVVLAHKGRRFMLKL